MKAFQRIALNSVELIQSSNINPVEAWELSVRKIFPNSKSMQEKGCPKSTFLGLCEEGLIKGIKADAYTRSIKNKEYALKALSLLREDTTLSTDCKKLWSLICPDKSSNGQMEVVTALWNNNLIQ